MEIAEDENEDKRQSIVVEDHPTMTKASPIADSHTQIPTTRSTIQSPDLESSASHLSMVSDATALNSSATSEFRPRSPTKSLDGRRKSSQSTRPDMYSYNSYGSSGRPKVKLGPRPSLDIAGRSQTSGSSGSYRPISTLPPGLKLVSNSSKTKKKGPLSEHSTSPPSMMISPPPLSVFDSHHTPLIRPHTSGGRPKTSSGSSVRSLMSSSTIGPKSPMMTPEKMRLMKAMQIRKKQMESASPPQSTLSSIADVSEPPSIPEIHLQRTSKEVEQTSDSLSQIEKADSAIAIEAASMIKAPASDTTRTSSAPESPIDPQDRTPSTKASSISDSTDETVRENCKDLPSDESNANDITEIGTESLGTNLIEVQPVGHNVSIIENKACKEMTTHEASEKRPEPQSLSEAPEDGVGERNSNETSSATPTSEALIANTLHGETTNVSQKEKDDVSIVAPTETSEAPASPSRELKIPRSKFSAHHLDAIVTVTPNQPELTSAEQDHTNGLPKSPTGSRCSTDTKRSFTEEENDSKVARQGRQKRRTFVEPIRTDLSTERSGHNSEADLLSDDEFMDELQSATVQEAKPMSVTKSPRTPHFPTATNRLSRAFSTPFASKNKMLSPHDSVPDPFRSTSASAAYLNRVQQPQLLPVVKKVSLGSGISQRIKALEKLSSSTTTATPPPNSSRGSSPIFFTVRQPSRASSISPSIVERGESLARNNPSPIASRESSPEALKLRARSDSVHSLLETFNSPQNKQLQRSRPESISVTARIIRDPSQPFPPKPELGKDPIEFSSLDLHKSPLVIDHQKAVVVPSPPKKDSILQRRLSSSKKDSKKGRRSSITMVKDLISERRTSNAERRRSMTIEPPKSSTGLSSSRPPSTHANSPNNIRPSSVSSRLSTSSRDQSMPFSVSSPTGSDDNADKKSGRASRMLRKVSATLSASRKTLAHAISPTVREELEPPSSTTPSRASQYPSEPLVEVGDVNVQFPDTLLWKRRWMSLDSQGFLTLSQTQGSKGMEKTTGLKRFHLSEFRTPFIPEMEVQELPNSVVLDFIEGSGLQVACEDRAGQKRVLQSMSVISKLSFLH
jgi:hypothetical protein